MVAVLMLHTTSILLGDAWLRRWYGSCPILLMHLEAVAPHEVVLYGTDED
jgi:hypothetical protein